MVIGGRVVRGRIDAIFADDDGGATVVDWKTGDPPTLQKPSSMRRFSSRCTGWHGPNCTTAQ